MIFLGVLLCCGLAARALAIVPFAPDALVFGGVAMVPLRPLAELSGAALMVDPRQKTATVWRGGICLIYNFRTGAAMRDGRPWPQPLAPLLLEQGVLYVAAEPLVEALGGTTTRMADRLQVRFPAPAVKFALPLAPQTRPPAEYVNDNTELVIVNLDGTGRRRLTYDAAPSPLPRFSPDGRLMVFDAARSVWLRKLDNPNPYAISTNDHAAGFSSPVFLPGGTEILVRSPEGKQNAWMLVRTEDGSVSRLAEGDDGVLSPDGRLLALVRKIPAPSTLFVLVLADLKIYKVDKGSHPFFGPDNRTLYYFDGTTRFLDRLLRVEVSPNGEVAGPPAQVSIPLWASNVRLSPNGAEFFFEDYRNFGGGIYRLPVDGNTATQLTREYDAVLCISPDGEYVVYEGDESIYVMRRDGSHQRKLTHVRLLMEPTEGIFTPDGNQIIFLDRPGRQPPPPRAYFDHLPMRPDQ
jgi:hypothetical protein